MNLHFILLTITIATSIAFTANYPFPQNKVNFGVRATTAAASDVQAVFNAWKSEYYEENGTEARIKFDDKSMTVSEGIGYGMMIMACMDNDQNNTRANFDKLWSYYKKWRNNNGLMNWKINGFNSVTGDGKNGATDGDLDAACGLVLAFRQWGVEQYRTDARDLIGKIWKFEVNSSQYLKPGDAWDDKKNPSYFSTGAMELFKSVDNNNWDAVIRNSYSLIKKVSDANSGLAPNWCSQNGDILDEAFGYDAVRTPWRMGWAYAWFGHPDAAAICGKMATWIKSTTNNNPAAIKAGYSRSGSANVGYSNSTYTGCISCATMVSSDNQDFVNAAFTATKNADPGSYYNRTLQVLTMLMLSGNMTTMSGTSVKASNSLYAVHSEPVRAINTFPIKRVSGTNYLLSGKVITAEHHSLQPLVLIQKLFE